MPYTALHVCELHQMNICFCNVGSLICHLSGRNTLPAILKMQRQSGTLTPVCLNRGKHLYLLPSIEEDHYYGLLWVDLLMGNHRRC